MIEDESLSEQELVDRADEDERVRRVVCMDDVEPMATENSDRGLQRHQRRVNVLEDVSERSFRPDAPFVAIDVDAADGLGGRLLVGARADDAHGVAVLDQRQRLATHPLVLGIRVVPEEHDHASGLRAGFPRPSPRETGGQARFTRSVLPAVLSGLHSPFRLAEFHAARLALRAMLHKLETSAADADPTLHARRVAHDEGKRGYVARDDRSRAHERVSSDRQPCHDD